MPKLARSFSAVLLFLAFALPASAAPTTTTLTATPAGSSVFGQSVRLTVKVTSSSSVSGGTVTFSRTAPSAATLCASVTVSSGNAVCTIAGTQAVGSYTYQASYSGAGTFDASTSAAMSYVVAEANTTTTIISSKNPATAGTAVTYTATVAVRSPGTGTPTGKVRFYANGSPIGVDDLDATRKAVLSHTFAAGGSYTIVAVYDDPSLPSVDLNPSYASSSSAGLTQTVGSPTITSLVASPASTSTYGSPVTLTATVNSTAGGTPPGTVRFYYGSTLVGTDSVADSTTASSATFSATTSAIAAGTHILKATYTPTGGYGASEGTISGYVVGKNDVTVTLTSNSPSGYGLGQLTAAVAATGGSPVPTGSVSFYRCTAPACGPTQRAFVKSSTLVSGPGSASATATLTSEDVDSDPSTPANDAYRYIAAYGGNTNYAAADSATIDHLIVKRDTNVTWTLVSGSNPSSFCSNVVYDIRVSPVSGTGSPSGTVAISSSIDGALGSATLNASGVVRYTLPSALTAGAHVLSASYPGNRNWNAPASPGTVSQTVNTTATTLSSYTINGGTSSVSVKAGQPVTMSVNVSPASCSSAGYVTFSDGVSSATATVAPSGNAQTVFTFCTLGTRSVKVSYTATGGGQSSVPDSVLAPLSANVSSSTTSLVLQLDGSAVLPETQTFEVGEPGIFRATVSGEYATIGCAASGNVHFYQGATLLGSAALNAQGVATLNYAFSSAGTKTITASYPGDGAFGGSSGTQNTVVNNSSSNVPPSFTSPDTASVPEGTTAVLAVTADDPNGNTLTYSITGGVDDALFNIDSSTGALTFLSAPDFENPTDSDGNNEYLVTVTVSDGASSVQQNLTITVTNANDAPTLNVSGSATHVEDGAATPLNVTVDIDDADDTNIESATVTISGNYDAGDALGFVNQNGISGSQTGATLTLSGSATLAEYEAALESITFTAGSNAPFSPKTITFQVNDGDLGSNTDTSTMTVTPANDAPTDITITNSSIAENNSVGATIGTLGVVDEDGSSPYTFAVVAGQGDAEFETFGPQLRAKVSFNYEVKNSYTVRIFVQDAAGAAFEKDLTISITNVNEPPVPASDVYTALAGTTLRIGSATLNANDVAYTGDVKNTPRTTGFFGNDTDPEGATLTLGVVTEPSFGTVTAESDGSFAYTPEPGMTGNVNFSYSVTDGTHTVFGLVTITVQGPRVWYVNNANPSAGNGTSLNPFQTLSAAHSAATANSNDIIYVMAGTTTQGSPLTAGITLKNGIRLWGQGYAPTFNAINGVSVTPTIVGGTGTQPFLGSTSTAGTAISIANNTSNEIRGLNVAGQQDGVFVELNAGATAGGSFVISDNTLRASSNAGLNVHLAQSQPLTATIRNNTFSSGTYGILAQRTSGTSSIRADISANTFIMTGTTSMLLNGGATAGLFVTGFEGNTVSGTVGFGPRVQNATFDANPATTAFEAVDGGVTVVGSLADGVSNVGLYLESSVAGSVEFDSLDAYSGGGSLLVSGTGAVDTGAGTGLLVKSGGGVLRSVGSAALQATSATLDLQGMTFIALPAGADSGVSLTDISDGIVNGTAYAAQVIGDGSLKNTSAASFLVNGGNATIAYSGTIETVTGRAVSVTNRTVADGAGKREITFSGLVKTTAPNASGVFFENNDAEYSASASSAIIFKGGLQLAAAGNTAFIAQKGSGTSGGYVMVCALSDCNSGDPVTNSITTTTGRAIDFSDSSIGWAGLNFATVDVNGADYGVRLVNEAADNSLRIFGGTIQNTTTAAVYVNNANSQHRFDNAITTTQGRALDISNFTGGGVFVGGAVNATGTTPVVLGPSIGNSSVLEFSGGLNVTGSSVAVSTTNGNLHFKGSNANVIQTTSGTALSLQGTDLNLQNATQGLSLSAGTGGTALLIGSFGADLVGGTTGAGLDITATGTGRGFVATSGGTITLTGNSNSISTATGIALDLGKTLAPFVTIGGSGFTLASASSNGAATGIQIQNVGSNPITINGGSIAGATTAGIFINGGTHNFTYKGGVATSGAAANSVKVQSHTGGTLNFGDATNRPGTVISDGSLGILLTGNTGATFNFEGDIGVIAGAGTAFTASGGTINLNGSNTFSATSGTGFSLSSATVNQSSAAVVTAATALSLDGATFNAAATLSLLGGVSTVANANTSTISGLVNLGTQTRAFAIADGAATTDLDITAVMGGTAATAITKFGAGRLRFGGINTYTGSTSCGAGTCQVDGKIANVSVTSGGTTLAGIGGTTGSIATIVSSSVAPGPGTATLTATGNVSLNTYEVEIGGPAVTQYDRLLVTGSVTLNSGTLSVSTVAYTPAGGTVFTIISNDGTDPVSGTFSGLADGASFTASGTTFVIDYNGGDGNDVTLTVPMVNDPPVLAADTYTALAGTALKIGTSSVNVNNVAYTGDVAATPRTTGVLANDTDPEGDTLSIDNIVTPVSNGALTLGLDGSFVYYPNAGFTGTDSFQYSATDGTNTVSSATVTINVVGPRVYYVKNSHPSTSNGTSLRPFLTITAANAAATSTTDIIYVMSGTTSDSARLTGVTLSDGVRLWGQGIAPEITATNGVVVSPTISGGTGTKPFITGLTLNGGTGNEVRGLDIEASGSGVRGVSANYSNGSPSIVISDNTIHSSSSSEAVAVVHSSTGTATYTIRNNEMLRGLWMQSTAGVIRADVSENSLTGGNVASLILTGNVAPMEITGFKNNVIDGAGTGSGVSLQGVRFDADPSTTAFEEVDGGTLSIGESTDPIGSAGFAGTSGISGWIHFDSVQIYAPSSGLQITGSGAVNTASGTGLLFTADGGTIESTSTAVVALSTGTFDVTGLSLTGGRLSLTNVRDGVVDGNAYPAVFTAGGMLNGGTVSSGLAISGGNGTITFNGTVTNSSNRVVNVTNRNEADGIGGTAIVLAGDVTRFSNSSNALNFSNNTVGSITFSGSVDASCGTNNCLTVTNTNSLTFSAPVELTTSTGSGLVADTSSITFSDGNLSILTSGTAISATNSTVTFAGDDTSTLTAGVALQLTGSTVAATAPVSVSGSVQSVASATTSTISGTIVPVGPTQSFSVPDGAAAIDLDVPAVIGGSGVSVTKNDAGRMRFAGLNAYDGTTSCAAGTCQVDGMIRDVSITSGATLSGTGEVRDLSGASGSIVAPGSSAGHLTAGGNAIVSNYAVELFGENSDPAEYDRLRVEGSVSLTGGTLSVTSTITPSGGTKFVIIQNDSASPVSGTFAGLVEGATLTVNGVDYVISYVDGDGNDVALTAQTVNAAPAGNADSYTALSGTTLKIGAVPLNVNNVAYTGDVNATPRTTGVLGNDTDADGYALTVTPNTEPSNGQLLLMTTGAFYYTPNAGFIGTDSFTYDVTDGTDTVTSVNVSIEVVGPRVFYVKNSHMNSGSGSSDEPFQTITAANAAAIETTDIIYVHAGTTSDSTRLTGVTLANGVRLWGQGIAPVIAATNSVSVSPTITGGTGTKPYAGSFVISGLQGAEVRGLDIKSTAASTAGISMTYGSNVSATIRISDNTIASTTSNALSGFWSSATSGMLLYLNILDNDFTGASSGVLLSSIGSGKLFMDISRNTFRGGSGAGLLITGSGTNTKLTGFKDNFVTGSATGGGIQFLGVRFDADPGTTAFEQVDGGFLRIGEATDPVGGSGLTSTFSGNVKFDELAVYSTGTGISFNGGGGANTTGGTGLLLVVEEGVASATNAALSATNATLNVQNFTLSGTHASLTNIFDGTVSGSPYPAVFKAGGALVNSTSAAFAIQGGNATIDYSGTINHSTGNTVTIFSRTGDVTGGGKITFSGNVTKTAGASTAVMMNSNSSGDTVEFSGDVNLAAGANPAVSILATPTVIFSGDANVSNTGGNHVLSVNGGGVTFSGDTVDLLTGSGYGVTAEGGSTVTFGGTTQNITTAGVALHLANTTIAATSPLQITGAVTTQSSATSPSIISGTIVLQNATTVFDIADSTAAPDLNVTGTLNGSGKSVWKTSAGSMRLGGLNTYDGSTTVNAGSLLVDGTIGDVSVSAGATLGGSGEVGLITGASTSSIAPGSSAGILTSAEGVTVANFAVELLGTNLVPAEYDQLNVEGGVTLTGGTLTVSSSITPPGSTKFVIINNDGSDPVSGTFAGLAEGAIISVNGTLYAISYVDGDGNDVALTVQ